MTVCRIRVTRETLDSGEFQWVRFGAHGEPLASGTADLSQEGLAGPCELVLPYDLVLLERVAAPASQHRRLGRALRYLAEEFALPDPDRLHVVALPATQDNALCLGIMDHHWLSALLDRLRGAGLMPVAAYPESLLPALSPHTWTVVLLADGEGFVRTEMNEAVSLDVTENQAVPVNLRLATDSARAAGEEPRALIVRPGRNVRPPDIEAWSTTLGVPIQLGPEWHWADAQRRPPLDLLQGEFASGGGAGAWLGRLRRPAILAVTFVMLASLALAIDWASKVRERNALVAEMHAMFRETFGDKAAVVDAPLQMSRALSELRQRTGEVGSGDFLALLNVAAILIPVNVRQQVREIGYERATLTVTLRPTPESEALLQRLRGTPLPAGYRLVPAEASTNGGIVLRIHARQGS